MRREPVVMLGISLAAAISFTPLYAEPAQPNAPPAMSSRVSGWDGFIAGIRDLPTRMLARLPVSMQQDPQIQQEVGRLALAAITSTAIDMLSADGDHPSFVPALGQVLNVGQPNADTVYRVARITAGGSYRIRGLRGTLPIVRIGESGPSPSEPGWTPEKRLRPHHDLSELKVDAEGRYDVLLSPERPAGYTGDWWQLHPGTNKLLVRMMSADWEKEIDPTFSIERVDSPVTRPRPPAAQLEAHLVQLPKSINFLGPLFVDHVQKLRDAGFVNKLKSFDISTSSGLVGQAYYEGAYELTDDEALIVEAKSPAKCLYRSLILTNEIYETTDWTNNHSSLNASQAKVDADGVLRIVVSARDPGVPNWLDTAGNQRGLIQGRWTDCDSQPVPSTRKLAFKDVRAALPKDTPSVSIQERERIIRERRAAYQQRPQW